MLVFASPADIKAAIGRVVGPTDWFTVDQDRIAAFADATDDHQWIHLDAERARATPFGGTIAHGFLTLALVPHFARALFAAENVLAVLNYGLDRVRFPVPVPSGGRLRARGEIVRAEPAGAGALQVASRISMELDGAEKPACVAETVARWMFLS